VKEKKVMVSFNTKAFSFLTPSIGRFYVEAYLENLPQEIGDSWRFKTKSGINFVVNPVSSTFNGVEVIEEFSN